MWVVRWPNKGDNSSDRPIIVAHRKREKKEEVRKEGRKDGLNGILWFACACRIT